MIKVPPIYPREADIHKKEAGRVLVVAGSRKMSGAAFLTSRAALRSGAGYVCAGLPNSIVAPAIANPSMTCVLVEPLPESENGVIGIRSKEMIFSLMERYDVLAIGPGLTTDPQVQKLVVEILKEMRKPVVVDADGLNAIARQPVSFYQELKREQGLPILTPHPGEFARLTDRENCPREQVLREQECREFAKTHEVVCVLKGAGTVVSNGDDVYTNTTGNPGMATAGSGDVLTGVIAALRSHGYDSMEAAILGVYLHGLAGDLATEELGEWSVTATEILNYLPAAFLKHSKDCPAPKE